MRVNTRLFAHVVLLVVAQWLLVAFVVKWAAFSKLSVNLPTYRAHLSALTWLDASAAKAKDDLETWLRQHDSLDALKHSNAHTKRLCVGLITQERKQAAIRYLLTTLMALVTRLPVRHQRNVSLLLLNSDDYAAYYEAHLRKLAPLFSIYNISSRVSHPYLKTKEAADYALAMRMLREQNCQYQLVVEDDGLASFDWFARVSEAIDHVEANYGAHDWMCIKFYTGFKYLDWTLHAPTVLKSIVYSMALAFLNLLALRLFFVANPVKLNVLTRLIILLNSFLVVSLLISVSKAPLGTGVKKYSQGRNTVAVLFNPANVNELAQFMLNIVDDLLHKRSDYIRPKDILMNDFKRKNNLIEFIVEPSVFQHIGMHSSLSVRDFQSMEIVQGIFKSYSFEDDNREIRFDKDYWQH